MIKDIRHTGIVVTDLDESLHFYQNLLGFRIEKQMDEKGNYIDKILSLQGVRITTVKMTAPSGQMIELLKYHSHHIKRKLRKINDIGISHIAFTVDDLEKEYNSLRGNGISFNSTPQVSADGFAKVAFCRGPEGTLIELVEVIS